MSVNVCDSRSSRRGLVAPEPHSGSPKRKVTLPFLLSIASLMLPSAASGVSCKTQSQMTTAERNVLSTAARQIASRVQAGDAQSLRANTIPAVAADFGGIASTVE